MPKYKSRSRQVSRLQNQETGRLVKQTYFFIALTVGLLLAILFIGIPALIKLSIFLGDLRNTSTPIAQEDAVAPAMPQLNTPPLATSSAKITIAGFAEAGTTVELYQNNVKSVESLTDNQGTFEFNSVKLEPGDNRFYVKAVDQAGNNSPASKNVTVTFDATAPELNLTAPTQGALFYGPSEQTITVSGTTDPDATITLNGYHVVVNPDGNFSSRYQLVEGDNTLTATAIDSAGNQVSHTLTVKFSR